MKVNLPLPDRTLTIFCLLVFLSPLAVLSQDITSITKISGEIVFDGRPDEAAWNETTTFPMVVHYPSFGAEPSEISEVMMGYDQEYLYVAARLYYKDPDNITATSKKRDEESRNSDQFGIILDTYDDNENALAFFTMPTAARIDYTVSNDAEGGGGGGMGSINRSWNTFWDVETSSDEKGWHQAGNDM